MTDTNARSAAPAARHKWVSSSPVLPPPTAPPVAADHSATPATSVIPQRNSALTALKTVGACMIFGGSIAMIVGLNRTAPRGNSFLSNAADTITSALQFANTSTLIVLIGAVASLIGAMSLIGALTVVAVRAAK